MSIAMVKGPRTSLPSQIFPKGQFMTCYAATYLEHIT